MNRRRFLALLGGSALSASLPVFKKDVVTTNVLDETASVDWESIGEEIAKEVGTLIMRSGFMQTLMRNLLMDALVPTPNIGTLKGYS